MANRTVQILLVLINIFAAISLPSEYSWLNWIAAGLIAGLAVADYVNEKVEE